MEEKILKQAVEQIKQQTLQHQLNPSERSLARFRAKVEEVCPGFQLTPNNRPVLNELYLYAHGLGKLDYRKGIFLYGEVGTGKSTLLKILAEYQRTMWRGFRIVNSASLAAQFATFGIPALNESTWNEGYTGVKPVERGFDEVGRETIPAKHYGNDLNVMQHILQIRYDLKVKTHITTNMNPDDIATIYGSHIHDRAIEMFNFIEIKGDSFRI